jgi:plastocyanin
MVEKPVFVGLLPQAVVLDAGDQVSWISNSGNLKVEFDANRCPFGSNIFQAPEGMRLPSGPVTMGTKSGNYKYRLFLNEQMVGRGEIVVREK